jgi:hypothetical protein
MIRPAIESDIMGKPVSGSEILLESLKRQKVDVFFGLPGGAVLPSTMPFTVRAFATCWCGTSRLRPSPPTVTLA